VSPDGESQPCADITTGRSLRFIAPLVVDAAASLTLRYRRR
jgi:hypothetical protein